MDERRIRVLIADDHPVGRLTAALALRHEDRSDIVGIATSPSELVHRLEFIRCDVVISDYAMPGDCDSDGLDMLGTIRRRFADIRVVVMTARHDSGVVGAMVDMGIDYIVSKVDGAGHLCAAVRAAYEGRRYLSPSMAAALRRRRTQATACGASA